MDDRDRQRIIEQYMRMSPEGEDVVRHPSHYQIGAGIEAKDIIELVLNHYNDRLTGWQAHCLGTFLKYRLRAGDKDDLKRDIDKSNQYRGWLRGQKDD